MYLLYTVYKLCNHVSYELITIEHLHWWRHHKLNPQDSLYFPTIMKNNLFSHHTHTTFTTLPDDPGN
jgi:hypothetical protein